MGTHADARTIARSLPDAEPRVLPGQSSHRSPRHLLVAVAVALLALSGLAGCATVGVIGEKDAVAYARNDVCGANAADSVCVVRSVERTQQGFRVVIDRRPPAGNDRLAVDVSGGLLSKRRVVATPIDTTMRRQ